MKKKSLKSLLVFIWAMTVGLLAIAIEDFDDEADWESESKVSRQSTDKAKRRLYMGGQDEQDIEVQNELPSPSRYPDGQSFDLTTQESSAD